MGEVADNTLVDGRYRILNRIGSGGMADVYRAEDTHLGRQVALKVLYRRFAQDAEFVERFRREASSAAGLQHPNVVNVFDRGEHDGTYYIAMEHLRGRSLKDVISREAPLDQQRAVHIGLQILQAAGFAHKRGVIHRDFKPHNVIVDPEDHVKVTDFGIARAGASEITETGSIMGTAQYLSPEQARGQGVSAASDLYSIGVIMYEMLGGRVPFEGDSAVSVALKHLSEPPLPLSAIRPDVHPALEAAIMRALVKDAGDRYGSAEELASALEAARARIQAGDEGVEDTAVFASLPLPAEGPPPADPAAPGLAEEVSVPVWEPVAEPSRQGPRRWPRILIGALLFVLALVTVFALTRPERVRVPAVEGQQLVQARAALDQVGFEIDEVRVRDVAPEDQVIDQDPEPGREADKGSTVELTVSAGPGQRTVPSVEGLAQRRAVKKLNEAGFKVDVDSELSDDVGEGFAIRTIPAGGDSAEAGSRIRLFVSAGPEQVEVPGVVGLSRSAAESRLEAEGLVPVVEEQESSAPEDRVIAQAPVLGIDVDKGSRVTITVSTGPGRVEVPPVVGLTLREARAEIRAAGLAVSVSEQPVASEGQDGVVVSQRPAPGTELRKGRTVFIAVGRLESEESEPLAAP